MEKIKKAKVDSLKKLCGAMNGKLDDHLACAFPEPSQKNIDLRDVQFVAKKFSEI